MESKEIRDLMEAYYSIYESKEEKKMKEEVEINEDAGIVSGLVGLALGAKGAYHAAKKTKRMRDYPKNFVKGIADPRTYVPQKKKEQKEEFDIFDVILEHLVAEGYADTNQAALAIMANMGEEWKKDIVEGMTMKDFKANRKKLQRKEASDDAKKRGHVDRLTGKPYGTEEAASRRKNLNPAERESRRKFAEDPN